MNDDLTPIEDRGDGFPEYFDRSAMTHCFVDRYGRRWAWRLTVPENMIPNYREACRLQAKASRAMPKATKTFLEDGRLRIVGRCGHAEIVDLDDVAGFVEAIRRIHRDNDVKEGIAR